MTSSEPVTISPKAGWEYVGCPFCGYVTTVPLDRLEEGPYCVHNGGTTTWKPSHPGTQPPFTQMVRVTVEPRPDQSPQDKFDFLAEQWLHDTATMSAVHQIMDHSAIRAICKMGPEALPFIRDYMEAEEGTWFAPLFVITGEDPARGETTVEGAEDKWLAWMDEHDIYPPGVTATYRRAMEILHGPTQT